MPQPVDPRILGYVVIGGAFGVLARALLLLPVGDPAAVPWATLGVNAAGSFLLGILVGALDDRRPRVRAFLGTGVLGGFTTYSAFAVETALWLTSPWQAIGLAAASLAAGVAGAVAGLLAGRITGGTRRGVVDPEDAE